VNPTESLGLDRPSTVPAPDDDAAPERAPDPATDPRRAQRVRRRALARAIRQGLAAALVLAAAVATVLALRPRPVPVDVATATRGPLAVVIEESGITRVTDRFVVSAPLTGSLARVVFEPGDVVSGGDVLSRIVPSLSPLLDERARAQAEARLGASLSALGQARAQTSRAAVAVERAEQDLARGRQLQATGALASEPVELAEFEVRMRTQELASARFGEQVAQEEVRAARAALGGRDAARSPGYVDLLAPASGSILRVHQKSAGVVQAGAPILEVGDPTSLEVVVDLLTTDAVHVQPGTPVRIEEWGGDGTLSGRVRRLEPSAFTRPSALGVDEQRVNVVVALVEPRERLAALADGYHVEARLVLWEAPDVVRVPLGAVFRRGEGWAAFRLEHGVARLVPVTVGHRGETDVEITSGLVSGAEVAVHPGDRVRDGVRVEPR
jgi:HlyD family secretion protein